MRRTLTSPRRAFRLNKTTPVVKAIVEKFPNVSIIPVREVLATAGRVIDQIAAGVRSASLVTLITGLLVLAGAIAAGHRVRLYDAVVMKVLGATRRQVLTTYLIEFAFLGATAGVIAAFRRLVLPPGRLPNTCSRSISISTSARWDDHRRRRLCRDAARHWLDLGRAARTLRQAPCGPL